ncbi:phage prohead protease, HK97 family [Schaalia georgiae F0490]|uniref:Phage prohead protease, HK97 family n=1 Tax=Schaalia georgiae F0490 TaxID=1125717 RepID=J1GSD8_9ACTO|nr:HK97 family phage prohead protease [Schaalia georgiae]EJF35828.1 phage prohead protease, HK97 family [Schaalia georgiae F0490]
MNLQTRTLTTTLRAADDSDGRTLTGVAVPFDTETTIIPGYREKIARGAIDLDSRPMLFYRHDEPIGVITSMSETAEGLVIEARISDTALGRDAATLARDGAIGNLSIGFYEVAYEDADAEDGAVVRTQTRIDLREVSLVPISAYEDARITSVRQAPAPAPTQEGPTTVNKSTTTPTAEDLDAIRTENAALARRLSLLEATGTAPAAPATETRSAGQLLRAAIVDGDKTAEAALALVVGRAAPNTTTSADARMNTPTFVADLTRLIDNANPLMKLFSTGELPATGNTLEFARLKESTLKVEKQSAEGAALPTGGVKTEVATATVDTYGGGTVLTRQAIERTPANVLDLSLRGLAIEAGKRLATDFATAFEAAVKGRAAGTITAKKAAAELDWKTVLSLMLDALDAYEDIAMSCDGLILNRATFEALAGMVDSAGRPILAVSGNPASNAIGTVSASGRWVDLDGLRVVTNKHLTAAGMGENVVGAFYNREAIRTYTSPLASLQDQGVLDLTAAFSVYQYAAFADEIPASLIPLKMGA